MKRILSITLALCMIFALAACADTGGGGEATATPAGSGGGEATATPAGNGGSEATTTPAGNGGDASGAVNTVRDDSVSFTDGDAKIAIITNTVSQNEEEYRSAEYVVELYGADKVTHVTWPDNFTAEAEQMVSIVAKLGGDPDIKAIIINQAVPGTNPAIDKLFETRDDIFVIYCTPQENPPDVAMRANLTLMPNEIDMGPAMVDRAHEMGATTFVHYSFPRHMAQYMLSTRRTLIEERCAELGIEFVDATAPDPTGDSGVAGAQQFILEDVPKMVEKYGEDTAFFSTNCAMQVPLIKATFDEGAMYPQPCCPSPYHGYPAALGIESDDGGLMAIDLMIAETRRIIDEAGLTGRFSTWPVPAAMMATVAGAEYAIKWIDGDVAAEGIDDSALVECIKSYASVYTDSLDKISVSDHSEPNEAGELITYPSFKLIMMDYLKY